ncbi:myofilin isoform X10 [Haematobia irritans]|uniref:myofilin isoform X10 n=1 Tax=Haematobia irritans TaxID=7368 RepID=UPI003F507226
MFKNHLEMIGRNESPSKKAKFWQSYIRSLKGSEDIRAHETPRAGRPYSSYLDAPSTFRSIYEEPATANERVQSHGYRYLPVSRDTYGYSPRAIYDHHYSRTRLPVFPRNRFRDMLEPNPNAPISAFTRDPFWWDMEDLAPIRARSPFRAMSMPRASSPPITRDSFLSPIKNRYLWTKHPARPLTPAEEEELFENF